MRFITNATLIQAVNGLSERLGSELGSGKSVVWLLSGGSNVGATVSVMQTLPDELTPQLTIMLVDERYGPPGHADSNWQQVRQAGFSPKQAQIVDVLEPATTFSETCQRYDQAIHQAFGTADVVIAQLGIGSDGHIAGLLPHSSALDSQQWVDGYDGGGYQRITITPVAWQHITAAYTLAFGESKRQPLQQLHDQDLSVAVQPAQLLKQLDEAYVYTDLDIH